MNKKMLLLFVLVSLLFTGCENSETTSREEVLNSGGAYKIEIEKEHNSITQENSNESNPSNSEELKDTSELEIASELSQPENIKTKILSISKMKIESKDIDTDYHILENEIHKNNGYVKSYRLKDSVDNKYSKLIEVTIRIPKGKSEEIIDFMKNKFDIIEETSETIDVTETYFDLKFKIENLEKQEIQLVNMYETTTIIEDMLKISDRLTEINDEKAKLTVSHENMQERMSYFTIDLIIYEIKDSLHGLDFRERFKQNILNIYKIIIEAILNIIFVTIYLIPVIILLILLFHFKNYIMGKYKNSK